MIFIVLNLAISTSKQLTLTGVLATGLNASIEPWMRTPESAGELATVLDASDVKLESRTKADKSKGGGRLSRTSRFNPTELVESLATEKLKIVADDCYMNHVAIVADDCYMNHVEL
ncbi:unnamed protein product, partial [Nesidiocoris tenuis]